MANGCRHQPQFQPVVAINLSNQYHNKRLPKAADYESSLIVAAISDNHRYRCSQFTPIAPIAVTDN